MLPHMRTLVGAALVALATRAAAQEPDTAGMAGMAGMETMARFGLGAQAILELTRVSPAHSGRDYTEGYATQPAVMAHAAVWRGHLEATGTFDLEGLTLRRGELTPGAWGEGYVDRRHPHTYVHELMVSGTAGSGWLNGSVSVGKGFAPFGTDDPMVRPFVKYPVNHHLSQILERAVVIADVRAGPAILEAGVFNGDEPRRPASFADLDRFGDSWSARASYHLMPGMELQVSRAFVHSPERPDGRGLDQRKWSAAARYAGVGEHAPCALVEWATTRESAGGRQGFDFSSVLAEGGLQPGSWLVALRIERSTRPEEERLDNPFRSPRPTPDFAILGVTRWESAALHARWRAPRLLGVRASPFAEVMVSQPSDARPGPLFVARDFYGAERVWSLSAGLRLDTGMRHDRMGRYGVAAR